jgi:toxin-antitoxin system PIN domain toxin
MSRIALLDVNVLVALFFDGHSQHEAAHDWFEENRRDGWATCPITENGAVRNLSNRTLLLEPWTAADAIEHLRAFRKTGGYHFWPASISLTDDRYFNASAIQGHRQGTDIYLLGLATAAGGTLATFDRSIPLGAVKGATAGHLTVISAAPEAPTAGGR